MGSASRKLSFKRLKPNMGLICLEKMKQGGIPMTDFQFRSVIKMVIDIIAGCSTIEEAVAKLRALIDDKTPESDS